LSVKVDDCSPCITVNSPLPASRSSSTIGPSTAFAAGAAAGAGVAATATPAEQQLGGGHGRAHADRAE